MLTLGTFRITNDQVTGYNMGTGFAVLQFDGTWTTGSDERLKHDIRPIESTLGKALALRPVSYYYNGLEAKRAERNIGFIAQDVEPLFPELVYTAPETRTGENMKSLNYSGLGVVAIAAIQELKAEKDAEIEALNARNAELESRLARIEAMMTHNNGGSR